MGSYHWPPSGAMAYMAIGNQILGGTPGSVLFVGATGDLAQDNAGFFYADSRNSLLLTRTQASTFIGDANLKTDYQYAFAATDITPSLYGYIKNTGSTSPTGGHGIGVLGFAEDTSSGKHTLYGVEGKVIGRRGDALQFYTGVLGQGIYIGTSRNAFSVVSSFTATAYNYTDEAQTIPYTGSGISVGFYQPPIIGGTAANNYSFWGSDTLRNDNDIKMTKSSAQGYIYAYGTGAVQYIAIYHDNGAGYVTTSTGNLVLAPFSGVSLSPILAAFSTTVQPIVYAYAQSDISKYIQFYHTGTGGFLTSNTGNLTLTAQVNSAIVASNQITQTNLTDGVNPETQWILQFSSQTFATGGSLTHIIGTGGGGGSAANHLNLIFSQSTGDYIWPLHVDIGNAADNNWGVVIGNHGTNSIGLLISVDNATTNRGAVVYSDLSGAFNLFEFRSDEDPLTGVAGTAFTGNYLELFDANVSLGKLTYQARLGLGSNFSPQSLIHLDSGTATASELRFTAGSTTGQTSSDGFSIGITSSGKGEIRQRENLDVEFFTNNSARMIIKSIGRVTIGDTSEAYGFFPTDDQKFLVNGQITSIGTSSSPFDILKLFAVSSLEVNPSANTNSGIGVTLYSAQGFSLVTRGNKSFNGGLPLGSGSEPFSLVGAFGQVSHFSTAGTLDGGAGVLCTATHGGYGATSTLLVGGSFDAATSDDGGTGSPTGSAVTVIGGIFSSGGSGVNITNSISTRILEPVAFDGGTGAPIPSITNQTALELRGTFSILQTEIASASSITNMSILSSSLKITGSTAFNIHGIHSDNFEKHAFLYNGATVQGFLKHQSSTDSTAANRIIGPFNSDLSLRPGQGAFAFYDNDLDRWVAGSYITAKTLFDHYSTVGNSGTTETDLYSDTLPADLFLINGDKVEAQFGGNFVSSGTATRQIRIYLAGTAIFDTGALTLSLSSAWNAYVTLIRSSSTAVRYMVSLTTQGAALAAYTSTGELTGLTLTGTNILKITGQAAGVGAASNDIVAKLGSVRAEMAA